MTTPAVPVSASASAVPRPRAGAGLAARPFPDSWVLAAGLLLLMIGLLMVASASIPIAERQTGQPFYFVIRQGLFVLVGLVAAAAVLRIPLARWRRASPWLLALAVALLAVVLLPGVGRDVKGSTRWISLGVINVQVSEVAKLLALVYVASYLKRHSDDLRMTDFRTSAMALLRPMAVLSVLSVLLLLEPDFGSVIVLMAVALGMMLLAGVNLWQFLALQAGLISVMTVLLWSSPVRRSRLIAFLDPWANSETSGYQLTQSLIAIGRGEWFGVGLGQSVQKLFYLPEAHTDFLFAVLAEELGLVGIVAVITLFMVIVWRAFAIGQRAEWLNLHFSAWLAYGIGLWFGIQALFNMGVNMGVLPTKGLTLPLMSYGGSSVVVMCAALALLLRIDTETRAGGVHNE